MINNKKWIISGLLALVGFNTLDANFKPKEIGFEGQFETGYQWDRINQTAEITDSIFLAPYSSFQQQFKTIKSYQFGGTGRLSIEKIVLKVSGHYGWIYDGSFNNDRIERANLAVNGSNTADILGGIGYSLNFCDYFWITPEIGYSRNTQALNFNHFTTVFDTQSSSSSSFTSLSTSPSFSSTSTPLSSLTSAKWHSRWSGPWIGFEMMFKSQCWTLGGKSIDLTYNFTYEFHYGSVSTEWSPISSIVGEDLGFKTKMKNMMGQVFRFDIDWFFAQNWLLGLDLKYTYWGNSHSKKAHVNSREDLGLTPTQNQRITQLNWHSFSALVNLGCMY